MPEPSLTRKVSVGAARRLFAQDLLSRAGVSVTIASALAAAGVLTDRLIGPGLDPAIVWSIAGAGVLAGAAWAFLRAWPKRARPIDGAIAADHRLALRGRLSSGLALEGRTGADPFAALAVSDAESAARAVEPRRAAPIRLDNWWAAWPILTGACAALSFVAPMDLLTDKRIQVEQAERIAQADQAAQQVEDAARELEKLESSQQATDADANPAAQLEALEKLKEQLRDGANPDDAKAQAAGALTEAADNLQRAAEAKAEAAEQASRSLGELKPEEVGEPTSAARRMGEALKGGDLQAAERAAADLAERLDQLSPQERQAEGARLERLAQQLSELAKAKQKEADSPRAAESELRKQGVNAEEAKSFAENADQSKVEEELRKRGFDEQQAKDLAERLAQERNERETRRQSAEQLKDLADGVKEAERHIREPSQSQPQNQNQSDPGNQTKSSDKPSDKNESKPQPGDRSPTVPQGVQNGKDQQQGQSGQSQQQQGGQQGAQPSEQKPTSQSNQQQGNQQQQQQGNQPDGAQPGSQTQPGNQQQPGTQPGQPQGNQPNAQPGGNQPSQQPAGDRKGQTPGNGTGQPSEQNSGGQHSESTQPSGAGGNGAGRGEQQKPVWQLKDRFANLRKNAERSQQQQRDAQRLRDQADKIVDSMSPEQRAKAAQQARDRAARATRNAPPLTDVKSTPEDFRRQQTGANEDPGEVLSEFNDPNAQVDRSGRTSSRPMQPTAVEAAKSVQKAIEEKQLPARYRNVQKYFERAAEREQKQPAAPPPAPAQDAKDAPPAQPSK